MLNQLKIVVIGAITVLALAFITGLINSALPEIVDVGMATGEFLRNIFGF